MLLGVLRMPPECWIDSEIDVAQRYSRYLEAADRIEKDEAKIAEMREKITFQMELIEHYENRLSKRLVFDITDWIALLITSTLALSIGYVVVMSFQCG
jgi:hypothetical protein